MYIVYDYELNSTKCLLNVNMYFINISTMVDFKTIQNEWKIFFTILRTKLHLKKRKILEEHIKQTFYTTLI